MDQLPTSMTAMVFRSTVYALRNFPELFRGEPRPASYDMLFKDPRDGCAKHDDVWGG